MKDVDHLEMVMITLMVFDDLNLLLTRTSRAVRGALPDQSRRGRRSGLRWKIASLLCFFRFVYLVVFSCI